MSLIQEALRRQEEEHRAASAAEARTPAPGDSGLFTSPPPKAPTGRPPPEVPSRSFAPAVIVVLLMLVLVSACGVLAFRAYRRIGVRSEETSVSGAGAEASAVPVTDVAASEPPEPPVMEPPERSETPAAVAPEPAEAVPAVGADPSGVAEVKPVPGEAVAAVAPRESAPEPAAQIATGTAGGASATAAAARIPVEPAETEPFSSVAAVEPAVPAGEAPVPAPVAAPASPTPASVPPAEVQVAQAEPAVPPVKRPSPGPLPRPLPVLVPSAEPQPEGDVQWPRIHVTGLLAGDGEGAAIVNGRVIGVGETVEGAKLVGVSRLQADFVFQGVRREVRMGQVIGGR